MSKELIEALSANRCRVAMMILSSTKCDPAITDDKGNTAVHLAVQNNNTDLLSKLVQKGFDPNQENLAKECPLHLAARQKKIDCANTLLGFSACVDALNADKQTPLHLAVRFNSFSLARLCVQHGADVTAEDVDHKTPSHYAHEKKLWRIYQLLNTPYIDAEASDTDSEDDDDYALSDEDLALNECMANLSINPEEKPTYVFPHYRGVHYYKQHFTREDRKNSKAFHAKQDREKEHSGIFSAATYELAGVSFGIPAVAAEQAVLDENELRLAAANTAVIQSMKRLDNGQVKQCLGNSKASREKYNSRYFELIQRYVNSYQGLIADLEKAPKIKIDGRSSERTRDKWTILKVLGFTKLPFISTSEDVAWGMQYATAILNWDKAAYRPRLNPNITVLTPEYQADGHCRYPYLGILYVTIHTKKQLDEGFTTRILDLFSNDEIDLNPGPGGHEKSGYVKARERVFVGGIDGKYVQLSMSIRVPNFYHKYRPFIAEKYGIDEVTYNNFKLKLSRYAPKNKGSNPANEREFFRTEQNIIQNVICNQKVIIEKRVKAIAKQSGKKLAFLSVNNKKCRTTKMPEISEFKSAHERSRANRP